VSASLKLASPATHECWVIPVLWEDEHLLALDKPGRLLTSPDRFDPERPSLLGLLHRDIQRSAAWVRERHLGYLANAHRLDFDTTGVLLLAKSKAVLISLADAFGNEKPERRYLALAQGARSEDHFEVAAKLGPDPTRPGLVRVDPKHGKRSLSRFEVVERFRRFTLLDVRPVTDRTHQVRVHLRHVGLPLAGDSLYGGHPLLLSRLKPNYRPKRHEPERPLLGRAALHLAELRLAHPVTGAEVVMVSPWPKDLTVAVKYLRRFAVRGGGAGTGMARDTSADSPEAPSGETGSGPADRGAGRAVRTCGGPSAR
jgi:RluA family pseudouridine synthase